MTRLETLIERLCPEGVGFLKIELLAKTMSPPIKINTLEYKSEGLYPIIDQGQKYISGFTDTENVFPKDEYIIFGDHTCVVKYINFAFAQGADGIKVIKAKNEIITAKYLYYCMSNIKLEMSYSRHWSKMKAKLIPVPPLEVQQEIVRILDSFTALTAELQAELQARKKQYEYYRNELLTFSDDVPKTTLRSVAKNSSSGGTPSKGNDSYYVGGTIPWIRTQDVKFNQITQVDSYITEKAVIETSAKWIPENCVIIAISGASAGRCAINKIKATTNQHCLNLEIDGDKALYKYIFYCVCGQYEELIAKKQGARGDLNSSLILGLTIPLPSLETQHRIVSILDRFDTLCNDLTTGLPAEIAARQKQYEYYRDKLLTFKEKA